MFVIKTLALTALVGISLSGTASAQNFPEIAGTPGRGNSSAEALQPNGAPVSNGYQAEPEDFQRGRIMSQQRERVLDGSPEGTGTLRR